MRHTIAAFRALWKEQPICHDRRKGKRFEIRPPPKRPFAQPLLRGLMREVLLEKTLRHAAQSLQHYWLPAVSSEYQRLELQTLLHGFLPPVLPLSPASSAEPTARPRGAGTEEEDEADGDDAENSPDRGQFGPPGDGDDPRTAAAEAAAAAESGAEAVKAEAEGGAEGGAAGGAAGAREEEEEEEEAREMRLDGEGLALFGGMVRSSACPGEGMLCQPRCTKFLNQVSEVKCPFRAQVGRNARLRICSSVSVRLCRLSPLTR